MQNRLSIFPLAVICQTGRPRILDVGWLIVGALLARVAKHAVFTALLPARESFFRRGRIWLVRSRGKRLRVASMQFSRRSFLERALGCSLVAQSLRRGDAAVPPVVAPSELVVWPLDNLRAVGGASPTVLGAPRVVVDSGRSVLGFNGVSDGLIFPQNPLAGRAAFTIEVLFRPDGDGPPAQRFVHLEDSHQNRALLETRVTADKKWYLDTFLYAPPHEPGLTLVDPNQLRPCGRWYWAALVYDGEVMAHFVNGVKERQGVIKFGPMGAGRVSLGVRLNKVFWYKGLLAEIRFHATALAPASLQTAPPQR